MSHPADILEAVVGELERGRSAALAAVVATRGSTPQPAGALTCIDEDGRILGTLGGGCVEAEVRRRAHALLQQRGRCAWTVSLDHDEHDGDGMICGGQMDVAVDVLTPGGGDDARRLRDTVEQLRQGRDADLVLDATRGDEHVQYVLHLEAPPRLLVVGGGHISLHLAGFAVPLGFRVTVLDDRVEFANPHRFPPPVRTMAEPIADALRREAIDAGTYIVIVTRGHAHDEDALAAVLDSPARYVGMIGSRRKIDTLYARLRARGARDDRLARVHAPIGLDIHAVTPVEIALSIAAELTRVRRATCLAPVEGPLPAGSPSP